jgi:hypothetical protein
MLAPFLILHFALTFLLVTAFGYFQVRAREDEERVSCLSLAAIIVIVTQAVLSVLVYQGTILFPFAALFLAFTLVCHHAIIHWNSDFRREACSCVCFQCKDIRNHETWVVAALVAAFISGAQI